MREPGRMKGPMSAVSMTAATLSLFTLSEGTVMPKRLSELAMDWIV